MTNTKDIEEVAEFLQSRGYEGPVPVHLAIMLEGLETEPLSAPEKV